MTVKLTPFQQLTLQRLQGQSHLPFGRVIGKGRESIVSLAKAPLEDTVLSRKKNTQPVDKIKISEVIALPDMHRLAQQDQENLLLLTRDFPGQFATPEIFINKEQAQIGLMPYLNGLSLGTYHDAFRDLFVYTGKKIADNDLNWLAIKPTGFWKSRQEKLIIQKQKVFAKAFLSSMKFIANIPQRHFDNYIKIVNSIYENSGRCDFAHLENLLYDKKQGFKLLDIRLRWRIVDFSPYKRRSFLLGPLIGFPLANVVCETNLKPIVFLSPREKKVYFKYVTKILRKLDKAGYPLTDRTHVISRLNEYYDGNFSMSGVFDTLDFDHGVYKG